MATSKEEIRKWLNEAKLGGATHLLVVCDTFDYEDYDVWILPGKDINKEIADYQKNMQRVMEVYNLSMDLEEQLNELRSWNL